MVRLKKLKMRGFKSFLSKTEIPFPSGFNAVCGPNGSGKCVTGDTLVQLSSGERREIKDIVENALDMSNEIVEEKEEIKTYENPEEVKVISMNPRTLKLEEKEVTAFVKTKAPKKILQIKTKSGREIKTTDYHPLFTIKDSKVKAKKGSELKEGTKIAVPRELPIKGKDKERIASVTNKTIETNPNLDLIPGINDLVKEVKEDLNINIKIARKDHPKLAAYIEKRCETSRKGLKEIVDFFEKELSKRKRLNASKAQIEGKIERLKKFGNSNIYWDEIVEIKEISPKEDYVYDLCVSDNHNFIGEDIIVHNSNLVDAITFALGTLSTKTIRAGKLEDLIFNGQKEDLNEAEVSLFIDNSSEEIPVEEAEVRVTRKINKNGNSIYKLNGKTVTRRRLTDILANARIYPDGHNIIMQGDITKLIEMNPEERREIIDEISGIAEFDKKRKDAEKELEKVSKKLNEARIVLNEKKNNLEKLKKEKKDAEKHKKLEEDLKKLNASITQKKLKEKEGEVKELKEKFEKKKESLEEVNKSFEEKDSKLDRLEEQQEEIRKERIEKGKNEKLVERLHEIKSKIRVKRDRIESNQKQIDRIEKTIKDLKRVEKEKQAVIGKKAVKEVLNLDKKGVEGTIASLADVKDKYKTPIEIAAGSRLNNIVVKTDKVASGCIKFLKKNKIGRATFLPLNKLKPKDKSRESKRLLGKDGVIDFAINLIDYDKKYDLAFRYVFQDTLVVKNMEVARKYIGKVRMVTLDGDLIYKSGAMVGGHLGKKRKFKISDKSGEIEEYKTEKKELKEEIEVARKEIGDLNEKLDELNKKREEESGEMIELEEEEEDLQEEIKKAREERKKLYEKKMNLQHKVNKLNVKKAKAEASLENLNNEMEEEESEEFYQGELEVLEKQKKEILEKLNKLGPVNLRALEEYESVKLVYDTLKGKVDKIEKEKEAILNTAEKIEKRRKETFMETLGTVNKNFQEVFHEITEGKGKLELEEKENIDSGLIISAKPKNKETLNLDSMSGGEKAVTALAFLFAVQRYKPAPFYILDEIDAALDKKNSKKIANLIKKYSKDAQFITITHNDVTIEMADQVYGVTMENGVSKILSIEMPEN